MLGPTPLAGDTEEEGDVISLEILPMESEILDTCLAPQPWDLTLGR